MASINETDVQYQAISDTIILASNHRDEFLRFASAVKTVYLGFLREGLLIRGGIAYGWHFKNADMTYSHALARAHEIETASAVHPRVVIDRNVIEVQENFGHLQSVHDAHLIAEANGIAFLNVVDAENWDEVYQWAGDAYTSSKEQIEGDESAYVKHMWLEHFLLSHPNAVCGAAAYTDPVRLASV